MTHRVTIKDISGGQLRPYADSEHHGTLLIEWQGTEGYKNPEAPLKPWDELSEPIVRNYVRVLIHPFSDDPAWHESRLKELTKIGPGENGGRRLTILS